MQHVAAKCHCLPGLDSLPELGEDIGQMAVGHFVHAVSDGLADAVYRVVADA